MQGEIQILDVARATVRHVPPAPVAIEQIDLRDGIGVYIQNHRQVAHVNSTLLGDDMLKFHVQLSGQRILNFEGHHAADLSGERTAVLMHEVGVTKTERLIAERNERSLTISIARQRFWEFLGEEKATASSALRSFIVRKRASPRLATATPGAATRQSAGSARHLGAADRGDRARDRLLVAQCVQRGVFTAIRTASIAVPAFVTLATAFVTIAHRAPDGVA